MQSARLFAGGTLGDERLYLGYGGHVRTTGDVVRAASRRGYGAYRTALRLFQDIARSNRVKMERREPDWQGSARRKLTPEKQV